MKKIIICLILGILLFSIIATTALAGPKPGPAKEITGEVCGFYLVLPGYEGYTQTNRVTFNRDWSCFCPGNWYKSPIWSRDPETGEFFMAFTCKR